MENPVELSESAFLEGVLAGLAERLRQPTNDLPSTRCIARPTLIGLLGEIRAQLAIPGHGNVSATAMLQRLVRGGVVHPVDLAEVRKGLPTDRLYVIGLGADPAQLDPIELLQAHVPNGVVCYFTALSVHELTTQLPSHHHIAHLIPPRSVPPVGEVQRDEESGRIPPLGTHEFTYQGLRYFATKRDNARLIGVQGRHLNAFTRFRVTTLEQTLLDTLHRPHSCGGPSVVFEAWQTGSARVNPERLATLLATIGDARLTRRVGYMLDQYPAQSSSALAEVLSAVQADRPSVSTVGDAGVVPLFAGVPARTVDARWRVAVS